MLSCLVLDVVMSQIIPKIADKILFFIWFMFILLLSFNQWFFMDDSIMKVIAEVRSECDSMFESMEHHFVSSSEQDITMCRALAYARGWFDSAYLSALEVK